MKAATTARTWLIGFISVAVLVASCGGTDPPESSGRASSRSDSPATATPTPTPPPTPTVEAGPRFEGFDLPLVPGSYWDYEYEYTRVTAGLSNAETRSSGTVRVSLGNPSAIAGVEAFPVNVSVLSGDTPPFEITRWRFLAADGNRLLGSTDGSRLEIVFDAETGVQPGGGFLASFSPSQLVEGRDGTFPIGDDDRQVVVLSVGSNEDRCERFDTIGVVCAGVTDESLSLWEYFLPGVGPRGMIQGISFSSTGGGFFSAVNTDVVVTLVDWSFDGGEEPDSGEEVVAATVFVTVRDDTGSFAIDTPVSWSDVLTSPVETESAVYSTVVASTDLDGFLEGYSTPGVLAQIFEPPDGSAASAAELLDRQIATDAQFCKETERDVEEQFGIVVLEACDDGDTQVVWAVAELTDGRFVRLVVHLDADTDPSVVGRILESFTLESD